MHVDDQLLPLPVKEPGPFAPCPLLLDTSDSMRVDDAIGQLNGALQQFQQEVRADTLASHRADISVIEIKDSASLVIPPTLGKDFTAPHFTAGGLTGIGAALHLGLETIRSRQREYERNGLNAYVPMMFLLTDGLPTDHWEQSRDKVHELVARRKLNFFVIGFGQADFATLREIAPPSMPPMRLKSGAFRELFRWISDSLSSVSASDVGERLQLPPVVWGEIQT